MRSGRRLVRTGDRESRTTARVVVSAAEYGDPVRAVAPLSWLAQRAYGMAPNVMSLALSLVERKLPDPGPPGRTTRMILGADVVARSRDDRVWAMASELAADEARFDPATA
jgi:hypothetical protein